MPLYQRALKIREATLGKEHPDTKMTLNDLKKLPRPRDNNEEKLPPLSKRALKIEKEKSVHSASVAALNNLALSSKAQGKYESALSLYRRALNILKETRGENHPDMRRCSIIWRCCIKHRGITKRRCYYINAFCK